MPTEFPQEHPPEADAPVSGSPGKRIWQSPVCRDLSVPSVTRMAPGENPDGDFYTS